MKNQLKTYNFANHPNSIQNAPRKYKTTMIKDKFNPPVLGLGTCINPLYWVVVQA